MSTRALIGVVILIIVLIVLGPVRTAHFLTSIGDWLGAFFSQLGK